MLFAAWFYCFILFYISVPYFDLFVLYLVDIAFNVSVLSQKVFGVLGFWPNLKILKCICIQGRTCLMPMKLVIVFN